MLQGDTLDDQLILLIGKLDGTITEHMDTAYQLFSQVVSDLNRLFIVDDRQVDGKVGVGSTHLVLETDRHSLDHVGDVGADGADAGVVLAQAKPDTDRQLGGLGAFHLNRDVLKVAFKGSTGTGYLDLARGNLDGHIFGNGDGLGGLDGLHPNG